jgi:hypothetical protein
MLNPPEKPREGDPMQALLVLLGAAAVFLGGFLVIVGMVQEFEYPEAFMSAHGGALQMLILGVPFLVGGVAAIRTAAKRDRQRREHET